MSAFSTTKMTARQFLQLGHDPAGVRLELVNGEIEVTPSPSPRHSRIVFRLAHLLLGHVEANQFGDVIGDVDTLFGEHDVRRPDIAFFQTDRVHLVGESAIEGPPDLCVEVISPSSGVTDRKIKFELYQQARVAHYWLVDAQARTFEAYRLTRGKYQRVAFGRDEESISAPPFDALVIPLSKLWA